MNDVQFKDVVELALQLSPAEQARLMERLAVSVRHALSGETDEDQDTPAWTPEELAEMMKPEPKTGREIVAMLQAMEPIEFVDADIEDPVVSMRWFGSSPVCL